MFIIDEVIKNAKCLILTKIEQYLIKDFKILNSSTLELKATNLDSNVVVLAARQSPNVIPIFPKIYICLIAVRERFIVGCRRLIGLDGCFLIE